VTDDQQNLSRPEDVPPEPDGTPEPSPSEGLEGALVWSSMDLPGMDPADEHE